MLMPRKVAHRKHHRGRTKGLTKGGTGLSYGEYGIQALEPGWITARQIEAARIAMTRSIKRGGKVWIKSPKQIFIQAGEGKSSAKISLAESGTITIAGNTINIKAKDSIQLRGKPIKLN